MLTCTFIWLFDGKSFSKGFITRICTMRGLNKWCLTLWTTKSDYCWVQKGYFLFYQNIFFSSEFWPNGGCMIVSYFKTRMLLHIFFHIYSIYYILERNFLLSLIWRIRDWKLPSCCETFLFYLYVFWTEGTGRFCQLCLKCRHLWKLEGRIFFSWLGI